MGSKPIMTSRLTYLHALFGAAQTGGQVASFHDTRVPPTIETPRPELNRLLLPFTG
jgi:hypothetical protein